MTAPENAIATTPAPRSLQLEPAQAHALRDASSTAQVELNLSACTEFPSVANGEWTPIPGDLVEALHFGTWKLATVIECPNNHLDPHQRISCWKVQLLENGFEFCVWQLAHMRALLNE